LQYLDNELSEYDDYLTGDVYGYTLHDIQEDSENSCWGFRGSDLKYLKDEVISAMTTSDEKFIEELQKL
jgi:hypothetical protein